MEKDFFSFDRCLIDSSVDNDPQYPLISAREGYKYMIKEVLAEFSFAAEIDKAAMVAAFLAMIQRPLLAQDPAGIPGFCITDPINSIGSGKTTLINIITNVICDKLVPVNTFFTDETELEKHILSLLLEECPYVVFDNIEQGTKIESETLSQAMSGKIFSIRPLGKDKTINISSSAIWFFTGNNITFSDNISVFTSYLNPVMKNQGIRTFERKNIIDWMITNRNKILSALGSIVLGPRETEQLPPAGRFKIFDKYRTAKEE